MKKKYIKRLQLRKKAIHDFTQLKGGVAQTSDISCIECSHNENCGSTGNTDNPTG